MREEGRGGRGGGGGFGEAKTSRRGERPYSRVAS